MTDENAVWINHSSYLSDRDWGARFFAECRKKEDTTIPTRADSMDLFIPVVVEREKGVLTISPAV